MPPTRFRLSLWTYRRLLRLYPERFRRRFADDMTADFEELLAARTRGRPLAGRLAAWRQALADLGAAAPVERRHPHVPHAGRTTRRAMSASGLWQDIRFAARVLAKDRVFTAAVVGSLSLGIGAATTVFTIVYATNLRALPFANPREIVTVVGEDANGERRDPPLDLLAAWRHGPTGFSGLAAWRTASVNLADDDHAPDRYAGTFLTSNAFALLGERPALGRDFRPEDDRPGAPPVILLGHRPWVDRYGADPAVVGRTVRVNGVPTIVIGVMRDGFRFPYRSDVWQPMAAVAADGADVAVFGRLARGTSTAQAAASLTSFATGWSLPGQSSTGPVRPVVMSLNERFVGEATDLVPVLSAVAAGFVLLIACANAAGLLLARAASRAREISLRAALGAGRGRIVRQLLVESLMLAVVAGVGALGLAAAGAHVFRIEVADLILPYWTRFDFDLRVLAFVAAASLGTSLLFGLAPAMRLARTNVSAVLSDAARSGTGSARTRRSTDVLLVAELALSLVLLAGATVMVQSALALHRADRVVDTTGVWAMRLALPIADYATDDRRQLFYGQLEARLGTIPGATSATVASALPFAATARMQLTVEGAEPALDERTAVPVVSIGPRYFETLGLGLLRGRPFAASDGTGGREAAIVNERFVTRYGFGRDVVGRRIRLRDRRGRAPETPWITIVGVAPTVRQNPEGDAGPVVYRPFAAGAPTTAAILVRAGTVAAVGALREQVRAIDANLPLYDVQPLERVSQASRWMQRVYGTLLAAFASIGLALAALGLYAVTAYAVARRTREIGVRMALGADPGRLVGMFLRDNMGLLIAGLALGSMGALVLLGAMRSVLASVRPADPLSLGGAAVFLAAVSLGSTWLSARRAARVDPLVTLRHE